ncbi:uncharacterized protein LOC132559616 [Ylistrum balloti]|uniref:uncharacterized protein LOC132559616 n=1 Tax=Ylistrum balloti TaxID=509963 RepID=UPI0029059042|nr:uncharacterized protein LOC132559616 [Ylistrum balloti]
MNSIYCRGHQDRAIRDPGDIEVISVLLSKFIDENYTGTKEVTDIRRGVTLNLESIYNCRENTRNVFLGGSQSDGIYMSGSDTDTVYIENDVLVISPGQSVPPDSSHKTVLYMTKALEAQCTPGYVSLQLGELGQKRNTTIVNSLVTFGGRRFVASNIYRKQTIREQSRSIPKSIVPHGQSSPQATSLNTVVGFACKSWPRDAEEWVTRTRLCGWPPQKLVDQIVCQGCHLVPLEEKSLEDKTMVLKWRISLASAERSLVHAFSHVQLKVYCLLKYFFIQLKNTNLLREFPGVVSSALLKTLMFFSVENSHPMLWKEQNLFYCFWFCFNILMSWAQKECCPNYFIPSDDMFQEKLRGRNQQKLFDVLTIFHGMKLLCLSHEKFFRPNILESISDANTITELVHPHTEKEIEYHRDMGLIVKLATISQPSGSDLTRCLTKALNLLRKSETEVEEVTAFSFMNSLLLQLTQRKANPDHIARTTSNKTRYQTLGKCEHHLILCSSVGTELCYLANFYFMSGNYNKSLRLCSYVTSQPQYHMKSQLLLPSEQKARYIQSYCGKGYTLIHKLKKTFTKSLFFAKETFYLPQLQPEVSKSPVGIYIPALPYAFFLSFLCCHELGDTACCDAAIRSLIVAKYDYLEGGHTNWTIHTLLGICYETLGDHRRAIRCYMDSDQSKTEFHEYNPALERIKALQRTV